MDNLRQRATGFICLFFLPTLLLADSWQLLKDDLAEQGVTIANAFVIEGVSNQRGGLSQTSIGLANLDLTFEFDGEKLGWSDGATLFVYVLGNYGASPSAIVGDLQATSNIEAPASIKLYELWWSQTFSDDAHEILFGLHDYNSVYESLETAALFLNSSFGISPDISQVPPSIFPTTSLSVMLTLRPSPQTYARMSLYDGVPGNPENHRGTQISLSSEDGVFSAFELGYQSDQEGVYKVAVGYWHRDTKFFDEINGNLQSKNRGFYFIAEKQIGPNMAVFMQVSNADSQRNRISSYQGFGVTWTDAWLAGDQFGFAVGRANNSDNFLQVNLGIENAESVLELSYLFQPLDWLEIQPDIQYIKNPNMDPDIKDALVIALRATILF